MPGGYAGTVLEVNLTTGKITKKPLDMKEAQMFIGGRGLGAKWLWDRTKPGGSPFAPDNPMCFMSGPLNGLPAPATCRLNIVTKSGSTFPKANPKTAGILHTSCGGRFTPELKFAGYDAIIVTGASPKPVCLVIEDDKVEIRPADKYWGMGNYQLQMTLDEDFGRRWRSVYIGPAGENGVRYANVMTEIHRACGRGGSGAVMGSKKLKFIVVKGSNSLGIENMDPWKMANISTHKNMISSTGGFSWSDWRRLGTGMVLSGASDWGMEACYNFKEGTYDKIDGMDGETAIRNLWVGSDGCFMCPISCLHKGMVRSGKFQGMTHDGPEYEGVMMGANCGVQDMAGWQANIAAADDYGLCYISMGNILGFLMECMEKGAIKPADLDGINLKWGDVDAMLAIQKKVAYGKGCGKLIGENLRAMVAKWGKGCEAYAMETKGQGFAAWNIRVGDTHMSYATSSRGADHLESGNIPTQNLRLMNDALGVCLFPVISGIKAEDLKDLLNAATGFKLSMEDYWKTAERIYTLERSYNNREGFTRADDSLPARAWEPLTYGSQKGVKLTPEGFNKELDAYYAARGWDNKAVPTKARIKELGLEGIVG
ncbi:MAG: aldehyde ferredoxin oxidoreductase family protein [bacterium]